MLSEVNTEKIVLSLLKTNVRNFNLPSLLISKSYSVILDPRALLALLGDSKLRIES